MVFWGPNEKGYSTTIENAGRYSRAEAERICDSCSDEWMISCEDLERYAVRVVDIDLRHKIRMEGIPRA